MRRTIAGELAQRWQQPVIVEIRPDAGTIVGTEAVAPDGYTLHRVGSHESGEDDVRHADSRRPGAFSAATAAPGPDLK